MLSFFPRGVLDEIFNLIESISEGFPSYSYKKAFGRVRHVALWATRRKCTISANLVRNIEQLYDKAVSAVQMNDSTGEYVIVVIFFCFHVHGKQLRSCRDGYLTNHTFPGQAYIC